MTTEIVTTNADMVRETLGGTEMVVQHETSATALAARARAEIETRAIIAMKRPRNIDAVRQRLLAECKRPGFARVARYRKPVGGDYVEGPSIRFAEAAARLLGNISIESTVTLDDRQKLVFNVQALDLETNYGVSGNVVVTKTVERKKLRPGMRPISQRTNSKGETTYLLEATDDEILNKQNAQLSKMIRTLVLRLLPGDIQDECMELCQRVARDEDARDPDAARRAIFDAFYAVGVSADDLAGHLGHAGQRLTPAELEELRGIYAAIRDGDTTWLQVVATKREQEPTEAAPAPAPPDGRTLAERLKEQRAKAKPSAREPGEEG